MKKLCLFVFPVLVFTLFATLAYTKPQPKERPESRAMEEVFAIAGGGYRLGVELSEISPHLRDDLKIESGVMIERVLPDSAAAKAGLRDGDIILKMDGEVMDSERDIRDALREMETSRPISLDIYRDGKTLQMTVTPEMKEFRRISLGQRNYLGVNLQDLDSDLAGYFQTKEDSGVLVTRVEPDSPASKAGLKSGDVITKLNEVKVTSADALREALDGVKDGTEASVTVLRHGKEQILKVTPEQRRSSLPMLREMHLPEMKELRNLPDVPEFRENLEGLKEEMEQLKLEMKDLKLRDEDVRKLKEEIRTQMEKVQEELKQLHNSD